MNLCTFEIREFERVTYKDINKGLTFRAQFEIKNAKNFKTILQTSLKNQVVGGWGVEGKSVLIMRLFHILFHQCHRNVMIILNFFKEYTTLIHTIFLNFHCSFIYVELKKNV